MTNDELNEKIRQACTHAAPDVLDAVLSDCNEQKGRVILMTTENKKKTWAVRMAVPDLHALSPLQMVHHNRSVFLPSHYSRHLPE